MSERKELTITEVKEVEKVGDKQIPKLSFKASDGKEEHWYQTFRQSLFKAIVKGQTISADVETTKREYQGNEFINRRITQVYLDRQPLGGKKQESFYRGKSPEELTLSAKSYALSYSKDLAVAQIIPVEKIIEQADTFYNWLIQNGRPKPETSELGISQTEQSRQEISPNQTMPTGKKVQNITELKKLLMKHKIGTHEAYKILNIKSFMDLIIGIDEAWATIKQAKGIE